MLSSIRLFSHSLFHHRAFRALPLALLATGLSAQSVPTGAASTPHGGAGAAKRHAYLTPLQVTAISVLNGATWQLNRPIDITFNKPLDFSSVNLNTIAIRDLASGASVSGTFSLSNSNSVVFQPACPLAPDYSDLGLQPGRRYMLVVSGLSSSPWTVLATDGTQVAMQQTVVFFTPSSSSLNILFLDSVPGPPTPLLHSPTSAPNDTGTHLEIGGGTSVYFVFDPSTHSVSQPTNVPLNLSNDPSSSVAVVLELDQSVDPAASNINSQTIRLERFDSASGTWASFNASVQLNANCTTSGSTLRIAPQGPLPHGATLRVVITTAFHDLVGEANFIDLDSFAVFHTLP